MLGLGTFKAAKGEVGDAVKAAVRSGYRLIDCAFGYGNEDEVGAALAEVMREGTVARKDVFVVSKVFQTHHVWHGDASRVRESLDKTLSNLRLEYLDLLLIHWPFAFEQTFPLQFPLRLDDGTPNPKLNVEVEYHATWRALEGFVREGKVKSIGVSNFSIEQLTDLCSKCSIPPAVNQIEVHPYMSQRKLKEFCDSKGIAVMAYSPLGSATPIFPAQHGSTLLNHSVVKSIASEAKVTPGQVLIRWSVQNGFISIPKSSKPARIAQNGDVLSWRLPDAAMRQLDGLNCDFRYFVSYFKRPDNDMRWHDGAVGVEKSA